MANEEITKTQPAGALAVSERPTFVEDSRQGAEHIEQSDMQIPRLVLAQKMSYEVDEADERYIEGLKVGDMFNGVTKEIYGSGAFKFVILRADKPRFVEFIPRAEGGGVKDPNVPADDPRTQWGKNGEKPTATKFYDFYILRFPLEGDPIEKLLALSFKSTGIKVAKNLNSLIRLRNAPVYAGVYELGVADAQNSKGKFKIFTVKNAGWVQDKELYQQLKNLSEVVALNQAITPQRDDTDFDPADLEDAPSHVETGAGNVGSM
jgi:hypothetical protein